MLRAGDVLARRREVRYQAIEAAARDLSIADKGFGPVVSSRSLAVLQKALSRRKPHG